MKKHYLAMAGLLAICFGSIDAAVAEGPDFPRLAGVLIGNPKNYEDPTYQAQIARLQVALINAGPGWKGWSGAGSNLEKVVAQLKAVNPEIRVFQYTILEQLGVEQGATGAYQEAYAKINAMNWWVYNSGTSGARALSTWQGSGGPFYEINLTQYAPVDSSGDRWTDWFAKWVKRTYVTPSPSLDGIYTDSVSWYPFSQSDSDWNRDGVADVVKNSTTAQWYRLGYRHYFQTLRSLMPNKMLIGNVANWGKAGSDLTEYKGLLNGGVIEGIFGESWSIENWGGWSAALNSYRKVMDAMADPKLVFFEQNVSSSTDYRAMRYGLTTCLMDDGYYAISPKDDFHTILWFDEFDAKLGQATSAPPTKAWQSGVYRRDFENGIALVNPRGNGARTVTLEAGLKRLAGKQDAAVNSGETATSVTLGESDGIILLRLQSQKKPSPVPAVQVQ
jgi:hypothetical protein